MIEAYLRWTHRLDDGIVIVISTAIATLLPLPQVDDGDL